MEPIMPQMTRSGAVIGSYKLLQQFGEVGMGTVFMAEQEKPVKRRVVPKIIKAGMDSAHVIARFEQERQALAVMDHPNIGRVADVGQPPAADLSSSWSWSRACRFRLL
jgi:serine/threonine protein kinase